MIISLKNFNQFLFVIENQYLFCDVELHYLNIIGTNFMFLKKNRNCLPSCSVCSSVPTFFSFVLLHRPGASNLSGRGPQQLLCAGSWEARLKFTVSGIIDCFQFQKLSRMCARRRMRRRRRRRILHNDATYFWELLSSNTVCIYCI